MNPVSGSILAVLLIVVCLAPRRWAALAIIAGVFFLTQGHSVDVAGLNLYPNRVLGAFAFGRVLLRRELAWCRLNKIDWMLLLLYNYSALVWILRSSDVTPQQFAAGLDPTVGYLGLRALVRSLEDLRWLLNAFALLLVPITVLVFIERSTGRSAFTLVGHEATLWFRNGVPRCQGSFRHAILLGSVAASFLPLYIGHLLAGARQSGFVGGGACIALVILANSAGPLTSATAVLIGWSTWILRHRMFAVRQAVLGLLLVLVMFMSAPIWYLPFKISAMVGGGGYHRGFLMDEAWKNLGQWWMAGMDITSTSAWGPFVHDLLGGVDVTNHYLVFGLKAGLPAILLIFILLWLAFREIGRALAAVGRVGEQARRDALILWGLGIAVLSHTVSWWSVSYFDQSNVIWLLHAAAVSGAARGVLPAAHETVDVATSHAGAAYWDRRSYISGRRRLGSAIGKRAEPVIPRLKPRRLRMSSDTKP